LFATKANVEEKKEIIKAKRKDLDISIELNWIIRIKIYFGT
jgi:hypothetical protein